MRAVYVIIQGVVPDYRMALFSEIASRVKRLVVCGGENYFASSVVDAAIGSSWHRMLRNRFLVGRRLLWQSGAVREGLQAERVIMELNPRILSNWVICVLRWGRRRPTVFWGHVGKIARPRSVLGVLRRTMLGLADGFVAYTQAEKALLRDCGYSRRIWVTNNSCLHQHQCGFTDNGQRQSVLYVGRLVAAKKVQVLVRAFALAKARLPSEVRLVIVGDGPERAALERLAGGLGIADRTEFAGHRSDQGFLKQAYTSAFTAASPGYVGLSVIQALGNGVPMLVARDEPHSPEIEACQEGVNTIYFPSDDVAAAADALARTWADRVRWAAAGPSIAAEIARRYTYEVMAETLIKALGDEPQKLTSCRSP